MTDSIGACASVSPESPSPVAPGRGPTVYSAREPIKVLPDAPQLAICLPTRGTAPIEFYISLLQMLYPLNTKLTYAVQKGKLPAIARNDLLENCLERGIHYAIFLDDDVLFPDITLYRLWVQAQKHPEAALITAVVPTKLDPSEPLLYADEQSGAYWDWPLGDLVSIHSAGAGCMIVNLQYVCKIEQPFFNDVIQDDPDVRGGKKRHTTGHDRFFMGKLKEAGGEIYADTGLILAHFDTQFGKNYLLGPDSPCFQRPPVSESFIPLIDDTGAVYWRRIIPSCKGKWENFRGYLDWLASQNGSGADPHRRIALISGESA